MQKLFYIKTYGCQMNFYDSDKIADLLKPLGYKISQTPENCDLAILNTCHIREKASEKMYSDIGRLANFKKNQLRTGRNMTIAICGCVAQAEGKEIMRRNNSVDIVIGPQNYHILPEILMKKEKNKKYLENIFPEESKFDYFPDPSVNGFTAFVSIQEGCDKFCTFCVVPYTRGAEFSRPVKDIKLEVEKLVSLGVREITLLGQNVNAYHGELSVSEQSSVCKLSKLCNILSKVKGLMRIRYITSHPADMTDDLINEHKNNFKLMPYLHLPIQAGSNKILKEMNRKYTKEEYVKVVDKLRKARPDIALTSDFIVGFPGENDQDFDETLDLVKTLKFAGSYSFKYSPRPGTPASLHKKLVDQETMNKRLSVLQEVLKDQQKAFNLSFLDKELPVLIEKTGKKDNQFVGRSEYLQPVHILSKKNIVGEIVNVKINSITSFSLHGKVC
ncbi:tRNA (N6-isopentenyl adenosine(37)-C2)-methylthiotransferase MiaB [Rickettsiales bacterium]|nr:tRNA (N6-isopentenyl adenosine(37)-C2)-methylthiotransferase MiaB [Rickettsiales bacterium]